MFKVTESLEMKVIAFDYLCNSSRLIATIGLLFFLSFCSNAQITQITPTGPATSWAAQVINTNCQSPQPFSFIKSITVSSDTATIVTYQPLSGASPCSPGAMGDSISISNTFTCFDGTWTTLTGTSKAPWTYTFSTSCNTSFAIADDYMIAPNAIVDNSGNIWVFFNFDQVPVPDGDEGKVVVARESADGGTSWTSPAIVLQDTAGSCTGGENCAMDGTGVGLAPNGNIALLSGEYDYSSKEFKGLLSSLYDGGSWSTPYFVTSQPSGETDWLWCYAEQTIFQLPGGALGAEAVGTSKMYPATCGFDPIMYLLISCDNGQTWGTGIGCRGKMHRYADSPMRKIGTNANFPTEESTLKWVGGRTLLGFIRNNTWTSDCSSPCGPLIEMYSRDLGLHWTFSNTNIVGQPVDAAAKAYTVVSPWLHFTGFGRSWTLFYGDRESTGTYAQMVRQITFDPESAIKNPLHLGPGQILYGQSPPDVLGSYTQAIPVSRYGLLIWFDMYPSDLTGARQILQMPARYLPPSWRSDSR